MAAVTEHLRKQIAALIETSDKNQSDVAGALGVHRSQVSKVLSGASDTPVTRLEALVALCGGTILIWPSVATEADREALARVVLSLPKLPENVREIQVDALERLAAAVRKPNT